MKDQYLTMFDETLEAKLLDRRPASKVPWAAEPHFTKLVISDKWQFLL